MRKVEGWFDGTPEGNMESEGGAVVVGDPEGFNDNDGAADIELGKLDGKFDEDGKEEGRFDGTAVGC